jgi:membrane-associated phospholipid phosphatase
MIHQTGAEALWAITDFGDSAVLLPIVFGVAIIALWHRQPRHAAVWLAAIGAPALIIAGLKVTCLNGCQGPFLMDLRSPSGHAGLSAATYLCLALLLAEIPGALVLRAALAGLLAGAIAATRVWLGVHTLAEVVVGLAVALPCVAVFAWARQRLDGPVRGQLVILGWSVTSALVMHGARFPSTAIVQRLATVFG